MSENAATRKGRNWLIVGIAAGVVILLLAAFMVIDYATSSGRNETTPPPATTAPSGEALAGITVGSGGTKTGANGVTKIGYTGTCDSAVQAATNYYTAITDVFKTSDEKKIALINQIVLPGLTRDTALTDAHKRLDILKTSEGKELAKGWTQTVHMEWGGAYKITDCTPQRTAVIQILGCRLDTINPDPKQKPFTTCGTDIVRLLWSGGDWKVVSIDDWGPNGYQLNITNKIPGWAPSPDKLPMPASIRDAYLVNSSTGAKDGGWVDYAGITRK